MGSHRFWFALIVPMALVMVGARAAEPSRVVEYFRELAQTLPAGKDGWHCQVEKRMTYCCPYPYDLVDDVRFQWLCRAPEGQLPRYVEPTVVYRFKGDDS